MNGESRDPKQRLVDPHKLSVEVPGLVCDDNSARQSQIAVKPRVPDAAAIGLDAHLEISGLRTLRYRPDLIDGVHQRPESRKFEGED